LIDSASSCKEDSRGEAMNGAALAALAGLLGIAIGRFWDTRSEAERWRRDQRIRVYERLTSAYYEVREAIRTLAMCEPGTAAADTAEIRVYEVAAEQWNQQVVATWLHGSERVIPSVEQLDRRVVALFHDARSRRYSWEEFQEVRQPTLDALEEYVSAVRSELRQPTLKVTIQYGRVGLPTSSEGPDRGGAGDVTP
jgi:hypothetical protein